MINVSELKAWMNEYFDKGKQKERLSHAVKECMEHYGQQSFVPAYSGIAFNGKAITGHIDEKNYVQIAKTENGKWVVQKGVLGRDSEEILMEADNEEKAIEEFTKYMI